MENNNEKIEELNVEKEKNTSEIMGEVNNNTQNTVVNEASESKTKKGDSKNTVIVVLIIIIILIVGVFLFLLNNKDMNFSFKESSNTKNTAIDNKKKKSETETKEEENNNESVNSEAVEEIKELDVTKSLNTQGYTYNDVSDKDQNLGISIRINNDKRSVTFTIDGNANKEISNVNRSTWTTETTEVVLSGFDRNIKSTYIGGLGQDFMGTIFFFIMEDGTVQYAKLFELGNNADGTTYYYSDVFSGNLNIRKVEGVSGVVKLYGSNYHAPSSTGAYTALAALKDGSFYDLGKIIN